MGRHSDPDPRWFWLSLAAAAGKALLALAVLGGLAFGVSRALDRPEQDAAVGLADAAATNGPAPTSTASADTATQDAEPDGTEPAEEAASSEPDEPPATEDGRTEQDGGDDRAVLATVQVLNGSGDPDLLDEVVAALEELGYQVVAEGRASRAYERTTVFWSARFQDEAEGLRDADERFGVVQPNTRLDPTIDLHVVVGRDWDAD